MMKSNRTLSQPEGLSIFFMTEMWERYGFYIVQFLLTLYLVKQFHLTDTHIYAIFGSFTALAYISPIIGGYLADTILGYRVSVLSGGIMLCIGYALVAATRQLNMLFLSLAIITMGTGLLKPNVSGLLGTLYTSKDPRRHKGFTLFYVGINMGEILAAFLSGYMAHVWGWHRVFGSACVGLIIGSLIFFIGTTALRIADSRPRKTGLPYIALAYAVCCSVIAINMVIMQEEILSLIIFGLICLTALTAILFKAGTSDPHTRKKLIAFLILVVISIIFWALYFQLYSSLNLYVSRTVSHHLAGIYIPTTLFAGFESIGVVAFGPILGWMWLRLSQTRCNPSTPMKFSIGMIFITLCMFILFIGTELTPDGAHVGAYWLLAAYLVLALGELSLSAIGLAMVTELVPQNLVGLMMGIWFVCTGIGGKLAGLFADEAAIPSNLHSLTTIEHRYDHAFLIYTLIALTATIITLALTPYIKRLIRSANTPPSRPDKKSTDLPANHVTI